MLPHRHRLRRSRELEELKQSGRSWRHPLAIMVVQQNDGSVTRFAFTASRRAGKAVARNRARRMLREAIRGHLADINAGWDCLVIARSSTADATRSEVEAAVVQLLGRANLLDDPVGVPAVQGGV